MSKFVIKQRKEKTLERKMVRYSFKSSVEDKLIEYLISNANCKSDYERRAKLINNLKIQIFEGLKCQKLYHYLFDVSGELIDFTKVKFSSNIREAIIDVIIKDLRKIISPIYQEEGEKELEEIVEEKIGMLQYRKNHYLSIKGFVLFIDTIVGDITDTNFQLLDDNIYLPYFNFMRVKKKVTEIILQNDEELNSSVRIKTSRIILGSMVEYMYNSIVQLEFENEANRWVNTNTVELSEVEEEMKKIYTAQKKKVYGNLCSDIQEVNSGFMMDVIYKFINSEFTSYAIAMAIKNSFISN